MSHALRFRLATPLVILGGALAVAPSASAQSFKLAVEETGIYRVDYDELAAAGLGGEVPTQRLSLAVAGQPVPLWIEDGGDGTFGAGDHLEFLGRSLTGETGHFNEFSRFNVYWLDTGAGPPVRVRAESPRRSDCERSGANGPLGFQHLERDTLRARFRDLGGLRRELWYWARLGHADEAPLAVSLNLEDPEPESRLPARLRLHFKGWSLVRNKSSAGAETDHEVELRVGGRRLARAAWDNSTQGYLLEDVEVPVAELVAAGERLELKVPRRQTGEGPAIDVSLLNWIEVEYPRRVEVSSEGFAVRARPGAESVCLRPAAEGSAVLFTDDGRRMEIAGGTAVELRVDEWLGVGRESPWLASGALPHVARIDLDRPSTLARTDRQADYLMIAHPALVEAAEQLAALHRGRGLAVEVVDVTDVYDEFRFGVVHPQAIRDFLAHAYHSWRAPRPRFVLLVGDASWDLSEQPADDGNYANMSFELAQTYGIGGRRSPGGFRFGRQEIQAYDEAGPAAWRNLIPTWDHRTADGPAASDNWFVDVEGDDLRPEMAIGRLPVATPEEVRAIVDKTLATIRRSAPGGTASGPREALLVTDHYSASMSHADRIAGRLQPAGFDVAKIYPERDAPPLQGERGERPSLVEAFDRGLDLVYFVGHGGRYEWRTDRADLENQSDLFTLDDVDRLAEQGERPLPVVLSISCYSAPFDHPSADSIGEKLLRAPQRGAVAVLAAAWRITPSVATGLALVDELTRGSSLGEAVLEVKRTTDDFQFVVQFNLLGDPALPIAGWLHDAADDDGE